jgi:hypothetical protein
MILSSGLVLAVKAAIANVSEVARLSTLKVDGTTQVCCPDLLIENEGG